MAERGRHEDLPTRPPAEPPAAVAETLPRELGRRYLLPFDTEELAGHRCDVLVVGSGIAGLTTALAAAARGASVTLLTKASLAETGTWYAQGGIAGPVGEADSVELHLADTLVVGQGLCDWRVVQAVVGEAADALADLQALGVHFDLAADGGPALAREGGHSLPRVLHTGDATGAEVQRTLTGTLRAASGVTVREHRFLVDVLTAGERCAGVLAHDIGGGRNEVYWADAVVLATGGCGQVFRVTTNPAIATGDGVAAAWRAGADIADLEFVQFHPTALDSEAEPKFLITEALRGEGAYLLDCDEERFMTGVHPLAELAPRDVVSREMERVMARCRRPNVWLDARHLGGEMLSERFPTVWERCREAGYDLARDLIPVAPAAHYMIGGVWVDIDGRTSLPGLYAAGEVTASGLHGANRLASNSLLEGLVFSRRIVRALEGASVPGPRASRVVSGEAETTSALALEVGRDTLKRTMSEFVGTRRSEGSLAEAAGILGGMARMLAVSLRRAEELELQNMVTVAALIAHAAWMRSETRGAHSRLDFPERDDEHWRVRLIWGRSAGPKTVAVGEHPEPRPAAEPCGEG
ncbi:MAG: L-aspartate oxidase [Coriobacteriia bacterium]|nr:L-aspartate oxidase [Coriobacteriia bacterium]